MNIDQDVYETMIEAIPRLRSFAISLCKNSDEASDLVQETLLRSCLHIRSFEPGTNMSAWLSTILRNVFYTECRNCRNRIFEPIEEHADNLVQGPTQFVRVQCSELNAAMSKLRPEEREGLMLVCAKGYTYKEVAQICGCAVGTVKSRVHRGRLRIVTLLSLEGLQQTEEEFA